MSTIKLLDTLSLVLLIVGGLNWGFVGFFNVDLVAKFFGVGTTLSQVVYSLVGLSAVYLMVNCKKCCKR